MGMVEEILKNKEDLFIKLLEILQGKEVCLSAHLKRVSHKDNPVNSLKHHFPCGSVAGLARHCIKLHLHVAASDFSKPQRQEVKEESSIPFGIDGNHLRSRVLLEGLEDVLKIGCFSAPTGPIVNQFAFNDPISRVEYSHRIEKLLRGL